MTEHDGCVGCKHEYESVDSVSCLGCKKNAIDKYQRMTNADRIRSMSDEELAEFIDFLTELCVGTCSKCIFKGDCEKISVLKWLQSEVRNKWQFQKIKMNSLKNY